MHDPVHNHQKYGKTTQQTILEQTNANTDAWLGRGRQNDNTVQAKAKRQRQHDTDRRLQRRMRHVQER